MSIFIWPLKGNYVVTSGFRTSGRPDHHGIDLDIPGSGYQNNVPVVAARSGTVSRSTFSTSYGEVVYIKHLVDGQDYETVYAHMHEGSRTVKVGDPVTQGQRIGYMGNTGASEGQHLHFEIHKPAWNSTKSNAINPVSVLGNVTEAPAPPEDKPRMKVWFPVRITSSQYGIYSQPPNGKWMSDSTPYKDLILAVRYEETSSGKRWFNIYDGEKNIGWINANQTSVLDFNWAISQQELQAYTYTDKNLSTPFRTIATNSEVAFIEDQTEKQLIMTANKALWVEKGFVTGPNTGTESQYWYVAKISDFTYGIYGSAGGGWIASADAYKGHIFAVRAEEDAKGKKWANLWLGKENIGWITKSQLEKIPHTFLHSSRAVQAYTYRDLTSPYVTIPKDGGVAYLQETGDVHQLVYTNKLLYVAKNFREE